MKRILCMLVSVCLLLGLTACGAKKAIEKKPIGKEYGSAREMISELRGVWTSQDDRNQIKITNNSVVFIKRDMSYNDTETTKKDISFIYEEGRIEWDDGEDYLLVDANGQSITYDKVSYTKGGNLIMPTAEIRSAVGDIKYTHANMFSVKMSELFAKKGRGITYDIQEKSNVSGTTIYNVEVTGEVLVSLDIPNYYYPSGTLLTCLVTFKDGEVTDVSSMEMSANLKESAMLYAINGE